MSLSIRSGIKLLERAKLGTALEVRRMNRGRVSLALALKDGDYLDGMCSVSIILQPEQLQTLRGFLDGVQ